MVQLRANEAGMEDELEAQAVEPVPDDNYEEDFEDYDDDGFESDEDEDEGWGAKVSTLSDR